jgi:hypothetical protein
MRLHENTVLFQQSVRVTSERMGILDIYVEKDYWVTLALKTIFSHPIGSETIFKGGTALSKCYQLIERFSEDIDLVLLRKEGESDSKMKSKLKEVGEVLETVLPEIQEEGITQKRGMIRKTAHTYQKNFVGEFGQVRDRIILESTWLGYFEPFSPNTIQSFVGKMMVENGQPGMAEEYGLMPFSVLSLDPKRTFCEKIMSLVRFSYEENPLEALGKKIRHTYDLYKLLSNSDLSLFFESGEFERMLLRVAHDDVKSFKNNNKWLLNHPNDSCFFAELEQVWQELKVIYNGAFKLLVYGNFPLDTDVLAQMKRIKDRMATIDWTINIPE